MTDIIYDWSTTFKLSKITGDSEKIIIILNVITNQKYVCSHIKHSYYAYAHALTTLEIVIITLDVQNEFDIHRDKFNLTVKIKPDSDDTTAYNNCTDDVGQIIIM